MALSVVVGGQYGSEGKGKATLYFAKKFGATIVARIGGPNAGHTVYDDEGNMYKFQQLPVGTILPNVVNIIAAGSYINLQLLKKEMEITGASPQNLKIDQNAVIIDDTISSIEKNKEELKNIGSTLSGTGTAVVTRIMRRGNCVFAKDIKFLSDYVCDTIPIMRKALDADENVIIEGTQGFNLSVLHSDCYPYCTSRDTTAAAFVSEAGLSPLDVCNVIMVLRTFPIRVAGTSGPFEDEITWDEVQEISGSKEEIVEKTTVTKKVRRVARFDAEQVERAIRVNKPNIIVLNHVDYVDSNWTGKGYLPEMNPELQFFMDNIGANIDYIGTDGKTLHESYMYNGN